MADIAIVTDRGCDLSQEQRERYGITIVPLMVRFGNEVLLDDGQLTADEFWHKVHASPVHPESSQPSSGMFEEAFRPFVERGQHVLCPVITGKLSGTYNSAHAASQSFPGQVTVFDTMSLSLAQAYQVIVAARAAAEGQPRDAIIARLEGIRERTHVFIALDTIEYIERGGRAAAALSALNRVLSALSIKPLLRLGDGELKPLGAARTQAGARRRIEREIERLGPPEMLAVLHTRHGDEVGDFVTRLAEIKDYPRDQVLSVEAGPALSVHAGPGVWAAAMVERQD
jgi:DegV family protein with EDD domain